MEVFALELAVKEKGLATVEGALADVRKEAQRTADAVTGAFTEPQRAMMVSRAQVAANAGSMAKLHEEALALDRTMPRVTQNIAKGADIAAIRVTHLATQFATTGNVSVAAIGGIQSALTKLGMSVGTGSVLAAAFIGLGTLIKSQMDKVKAETKAAVDAVIAEGARLRQALNDIADETDRDAMARRRKRIQEGIAVPTPFDTEGLTAEQAEESGIRRISAELARLNALRAEQATLLARIRAQERLTVAEALRYADVNRLLAGTKDRYDTLTVALASLNRQMNQVTTSASNLNRELAVPAGRSAPAPGGQTVFAGTRFDELIRNAQAQISARFTSKLAGFTKDSQMSRALEAKLALDISETFATGVTNGILDGFALGIERAIASGNIGEGFKAMTAQMLSGIGGAMIQFGAQAVIFGKLMEKVKSALASLNGIGAIGAGVALIAAGAALKGVASRMFDGRGSPGGTGGFGSGSGGISGLGGENVTRIVFGPTSAGVAAGMTPRGFNQFVIIGPNDPTAQRAIEEILAKSERRGGLN